MKPDVEPETKTGGFGVRRRWKWKVAGAVSIFVLAAILIRAILPVQSLNDDELRLVGSWTQKTLPGEYIYDFHSDGTLRFGAGTSSRSPDFQRWWIQNKELTVEYRGDDQIPIAIQRSLFLVTQEKHPLDFNSEGEVDWGSGAMIRWNGTIPWSRGNSEEPQQVD